MQNSGANGTGTCARKIRFRKGREYEVQQAFTTADGNRVFPDVVINLPDGKKMIVDSKVSLTAMKKYINEDDEVKVGFKEHVNSIKRHVEQLGNKNYQDYIQIESQILYYYLFLSMLLLWHSMGILVCTTRHSKKNIVIVTPATLLATLR
jgi:DNA recombination protein RmuC